MRSICPIWSSPKTGEAYKTIISGFCNKSNHDNFRSIKVNSCSINSDYNVSAQNSAKVNPLPKARKKQLEDVAKLDDKYLKPNLNLSVSNGEILIGKKRKYDNRKLHELGVLAPGKILASRVSSRIIPNRSAPLNENSNVKYNGAQSVCDNKSGASVANADVTNIESMLLSDKNDFTDDFEGDTKAELPVKAPNSASILNIINSVDKTAVIIQKDLYITNRILESLKKKKKKEPSHKTEDNMEVKSELSEVFNEGSGKVKLPAKMLFQNPDVKWNVGLVNNSGLANVTQVRHQSNTNLPTNFTKSKIPNIDSTTKTVISSTKGENNCEISVVEVQKFVDRRLPYPFVTETVLQVFGSNDKLGDALSLIERSKQKLAVSNVSEEKDDGMISSFNFKNMLSTVKLTLNNHSVEKDIPIEIVNVPKVAAVSKKVVEKKKTEGPKIEVNDANRDDILKLMVLNKPKNLRSNMKAKKVGKRKRYSRETMDKVKKINPKQIDIILGISPKDREQMNKKWYNYKQKKMNKTVVKPRLEKEAVFVGDIKEEIKTPDEPAIVEAKVAEMPKPADLKPKDIVIKPITELKPLPTKDREIKKETEDDGLSQRDRQILKGILTDKFSMKLRQNENSEKIKNDKLVLANKEHKFENPVSLNDLNISQQVIEKLKEEYRGKASMSDETLKECEKELITTLEKIKQKMKTKQSLPEPAEKPLSKINTQDSVVIKVKYPHKAKQTKKEEKANFTLPKPKPLPEHVEASASFKVNKFDEIKSAVKNRVMEKIHFPSKKPSGAEAQEIKQKAKHAAKQLTPALIKAQSDLLFNLDKISKEVTPLFDKFTREVTTLLQEEMCRSCPSPENRIVLFPMINPNKENLHNPKTDAVLSIGLNNDRMIKKELESIPSVTTILNSTLQDNSKTALSRWRRTMISQLGIEGLKQFYKDQLKSGSQYQESLRGLLKNSKYHSFGELDSVDRQNMYVDSVREILKNLSHVSVLESHVIHPRLAYRGVIDCVAKYKNSPVLIEWKKCNKIKPTPEQISDSLLQLSAYIGALNYDDAYKLQINEGMVVVAYNDGTPADTIMLEAKDCPIYWKKWLNRFKTFLFKQQGFPFNVK